MIEFTYSCAWTYVQIANEFRLPFKPPYNIAQLLNAISKYLSQQPKMSFLFFMFEELEVQKGSAFLAHDIAGLIEYYILIVNGDYYLVFPAFVNYGWQTASYAEHIRTHTFMHGYTESKESVIRLCETLCGGNRALQIVGDVSKQLKRFVNISLTSITYDLSPALTGIPFVKQRRPLNGTSREAVTECWDLIYQNHNENLVNKIKENIRDGIIL